LCIAIDGDPEDTVRNNVPSGNAMKRILIEWFHYDNKEASPRFSAEIEQVISDVIESMRPFMRTMQIQLDYRKIRLTADDVELSGMVKINGKKIKGCKDESLSGQTLIDGVLKETARFTGKGCAGNPEDLFR
jgi:hypothetical protein